MKYCISKKINLLHLLKSQQLTFRYPFGICFSFAFQKLKMKLFPNAFIRAMALVIGVFCVSQSFAQECSHGSCQNLCQLEAIFEDQFSYVPPPESFVPGEERDANITVNYNGFTDEAQEAFAYAVDIWASVLTSEVTIHINANFTAIQSNVLGYAGADGYFKNFEGAPLTSTYYPEALANKLHGADLAPNSEDLNCTFNSTFDWYYGTDGNVPSGKYDFISVVLHELGHGLGFAGSGSYSGPEGSIGFGITPSIYDVFTEDLDGMAVVDYETPSEELGDLLTSGDVYWNGPEALAENQNTRPEIYAPNFWNSGSSYSHLDEYSYGSGSGNSLMTPFLGSAEAVHNPGAIVRGMFRDMGWTVESPCSVSEINPGSQTNCGSNGNTYDQQLTIYHEDTPYDGQMIVNGQEFSVGTSPQTITLQDLPSNGQEITINISFSDDILCNTSFDGIVQAPVSCCANFRLLEVHPEDEYITLKNFGDCQADISNYVLVSESAFVVIDNLQVVNGDKNIAPGEAVTLYWNNWNPGSQKRELALYKPFANPENPNHLVDFVQWTQPGSTHESTAQMAGVWEAGQFVEAVSPYSFIGEADDYGVMYWDYASLPCDIISISAGVQGACNPGNQTYSQEIIVQYENPPSDGYLNVKNQLFEITGSPQTVVLTGLPANGQTQIVTAYFTEQQSCSISMYNIFSAPDPCEPAGSGDCPGDFNGDGFRTTSDLLLMISELNNCDENCYTDITGDGFVTTADILTYVEIMGTDCP